MPKVMVLFFGDESSAAVVDAVVSGVKSVRFAEVEVRATTDSGSASAPKYKQFDPAHPAGDADGVVLVGGGAGDAGAAVAQVIDHLGHAPGARDMVLGVAADASVIDRVARTGAIVIVSRATTAGDTNAIDEARALGVRVAKVAGWVRHGLGHEAEHRDGSHEHGHHGHDHHHAHDDAHHESYEHHDHKH